MADPRADLTVEEENQVEAERQRARQRELRDVFLQMFGAPGARTPHGKLILDHLEKYAQWTRPILVMDNQGRTDIYRTGIAEGRREVVQAIHDAINWREHGHTR